MNITQTVVSGHRRIIVPQGLLDPDKNNVIHIPKELANTQAPLVVSQTRRGLVARLLPEFTDELSSENQSHLQHLSTAPRLCRVERSFQEKNTKAGDVNKSYQIDPSERFAPAQQTSNQIDEDYTYSSGDSPKSYPKLYHASSRATHRHQNLPKEGHSITMDAPEGIVMKSLQKMSPQSRSASGRRRIASPAGPANITTTTNAEPIQGTSNANKTFTRYPSDYAQNATFTSQAPRGTDIPCIPSCNQNRTFTRYSSFPAQNSNPNNTFTSIPQTHAQNATFTFQPPSSGVPSTTSATNIPCVPSCNLNRTFTSYPSAPVENANLNQTYSTIPAQNGTFTFQPPGSGISSTTSETNTPCIPSCNANRTFTRYSSAPVQNANLNQTYSKVPTQNATFTIQPPSSGIPYTTSEINTPCIPSCSANRTFTSYPSAPTQNANPNQTYSKVPAQNATFTYQPPGSGVPSTTSEINTPCIPSCNANRTFTSHSSAPAQNANPNQTYTKVSAQNANPNQTYSKVPAQNANPNQTYSKVPARNATFTSKAPVGELDRNWQGIIDGFQPQYMSTPNKQHGGYDLGAAEELTGYYHSSYAPSEIDNHEWETPPDLGLPKAPWCFEKTEYIDYFGEGDECHCSIDDSSEN